MAVWVAGYANSGGQVSSAAGESDAVGPAEAVARLAIAAVVLGLIPHLIGRGVAMLRSNSQHVRLVGSIVGASTFGVLWMLLMSWAAHVGAASGRYVCGGFGAGAVGGLLLGVPMHALLIWVLASSQATRLGRTTRG
jgi:hypothetical protein